jgi:hypothetical protein
LKVAKAWLCQRLSGSSFHTDGADTLNARHHSSYNDIINQVLCYKNKPVISLV